MGGIVKWGYWWVSCRVGGWMGIEASCGPRLMVGRFKEWWVGSAAAVNVVIARPTHAARAWPGWLCWAACGASPFLKLAL